MKNNSFSSVLSIVFFVSTLALTLFSWVGSVYGLDGVQSLLSAEGIRWSLGHVVENYVQSPALGMVLIFFMGVGIGNHSGLYDALKRLFRKERKLSRKEVRALTLASVALLLYVVLVGALLLPWNFLYGVTGSWLHSPFSKGLVYMLALGIGWLGIVYGYASDAFRRLSDVVEGMSSFIMARAFGFVSLFFVVQFFSSLAYTHLMEWMGIPDDLIKGLYLFFCFFPFFFKK